MGAFPLVAIGLVLSVICAFLKWAKLNDDYFVKRKLVHLKPTLLLGNTGAFLLNRWRPDEFLLYLYNSFPNAKIFGLFDYRQPMLVVRDPEMLRRMTSNHFDYFEDHKLFFGINRLLNDSLLMLTGNKWRDMRATLSPVFTGSKIRQMFEMVGDCAYEMSEHFKKQAVVGDVLHLDAKELFAKYVNDVIATAAFGISVNSFTNEQNEFYVMGKRMMNLNNVIISIKYYMNRMFPIVMNALKMDSMDESVCGFFNSLVLDTMKFREKENIFRPDLINLLMQVKQAGGVIPTKKNADNIDNGFASVPDESSIDTAIVERAWSNDELVAQCFQFFTASFDTSASLLSFAAYELAMNPNVQDQLYAEIRATNERLQRNRLSYDELLHMKYMDQVVSEALRLWPPAMFTNRLCVKDYEYNDGTNRFVIEKGISFWIPIYALHRDPKYFSDPNQFDPERFSNDRKHTIVPGSYIPFGNGPRSCIGSRFALMEVKVVIYYLLLNFKLEPNANTPFPMILRKTDGNMMAENGISLNFKLR